MRRYVLVARRILTGEHSEIVYLQVFPTAKEAARAEMAVKLGLQWVFADLQWQILPVELPGKKPKALPPFRELRPTLGNRVYEPGKRQGAKRRSGAVKAKKLLERLKQGGS